MAQNGEKTAYIMQTGFLQPPGLQFDDGVERFLEAGGSNARERDVGGDIIVHFVNPFPVAAQQ